jgi:hypothetical protein
VSLVVGDTGIKTISYCVPLRCAQSLRRKENGIPSLYPAFTSQRARKTAPTLTRPFASL